MTSPEGSSGEARERDVALAGEYALGVLPLAERRAVEARIAADPAFAALVSGWRRDLESLDAQYAPVEPPAGLEARIEARLFAAPAQSAATGIWGSLAFWRGFSLASLVLAAGFAAALAGLLPGSAPEAGAPLVARLSADDVAIGLVAEFDPETGGMTVLPAAFAPEGARSLELWLVPGEGAALSLGVVPEEGGALTIDPDLKARLSAGALIAVSLEPAGGSPTGVATGPILVTGTLSAR